MELFKSANTFSKEDSFSNEDSRFTSISFGDPLKTSKGLNDLLKSTEGGVTFLSLYVYGVSK